MKIPFVGPSHVTRSINADAERTVNCFLEMNNLSPRAPDALYGRPGLELRGTIGNGPIRAMLREGDRVYVVSGNEVYRLTYSGGYSAVYMGAIDTSTGPVGMASNGAQVIIVDGVSGYLVDTVALTLSYITDPGFPNGVSRATFMGGYFLVAGDGSGKFYWNETPYDGMAWNALDFATAEGAPDNVVGIIADHQEVWVFGERTTEVYVLVGGDEVFQRNGNAFIEHGCAAADTVAKQDNSLFWVSTDDRGGPVVFRSNGYTPLRVSDHAVEMAMQSYGVMADARAWTYQQEGHNFYVLTFPTADKTWVYDTASGKWFEWSSTDVFVGQKQWRAACHVFLYGDHLVGDYVNGKFYRLNMAVYTDDGISILRERTTTATEQEQRTLFFASLQIDMETGVGGNLALQYSDDGGHTWSVSRTRSMGTGGDYDARVIFRRLGRGRSGRVWRISTSDAVKFAVFGANAEVQAGTS